jgi:predicted 2-oxoglutarate/Fe(II)-dependent dioxygenase YbiX
MSEVKVEKSSLTIERLTLALSVGLLTWILYTTSELNVQTAVTQEKLSALEKQISSAVRETASQTQVLILEQRVQQIEERLDERGD